MAGKVKTEQHVESTIVLDKALLKGFDSKIEQALEAVLSKLGTLDIDVPVNLRPHLDKAKTLKSADIKRVQREMAELSREINRAAAEGKDPQQAAALQQVVSTFEAVLKGQKRKFPAAATKAVGAISRGEVAFTSLSRELQTQVREIEAYVGSLTTQLQAIEKLTNSLRRVPVMKPGETRPEFVTPVPSPVPKLSAAVKGLSQFQRDIAERTDDRRLTREAGKQARRNSVYSQNEDYVKAQLGALRKQTGASSKVPMDDLLKRASTDFPFKGLIDSYKAMIGSVNTTLKGVLKPEEMAQQKALKSQLEGYVAKVRSRQSELLGDNTLVKGTSKRISEATRLVALAKQRIEKAGGADKLEGTALNDVLDSLRSARSSSRVFKKESEGSPLFSSGQGVFNESDQLIGQIRAAAEAKRRQAQLQRQGELATEAGMRRVNSYSTKDNASAMRLTGMSHADIAAYYRAKEFHGREYGPETAKFDKDQARQRQDTRRRELQLESEQRRRERQEESEQRRREQQAESDRRRRERQEESDQRRKDRQADSEQRRKDRQADTQEQRRRKQEDAERAPQYLLGKRAFQEAGGHAANLSPEHREAFAVYGKTRTDRLRLQNQDPQVSPRTLARNNTEIDTITAQLDVNRREMRGNMGMMHDLQVGMRQFMRYAILYGSGYRVLSAAGAQVREGFDLDKQLKGIQAISHASEQSMAAIESAIKRIGGNNEKTLADLSAGAETLAQAGVEAGRLPGFLSAVARLASATSSDIKDTAAVLTSMREVFESFNVDQLADQLAQAVNISKLNIGDLQTILNYTASTAKQSGVGPQQLLGAAATLSNRGIKSSTIATGLRQAFLELFSPDGQTLSFLKSQYARIGEAQGEGTIKARFQEFKNATDPLLSVLTELRRLGVTGAARSSFSRVVDIRAENTLLPLLDELERVNENAARISQSGTAAAGAATQMQAVANSAQALWNSLVTLNHEISSAFYPALVDAMDGLRGFIKATREGVSESRLQSGSSGITSSALFGAGTAAFTFFGPLLAKFSGGVKAVAALFAGGAATLTSLVSKSGGDDLKATVADFVTRAANVVLVFTGVRALLSSGAATKLFQFFGQLPAFLKSAAAGLASLTNPTTSKLSGAALGTAVSSFFKGWGLVMTAVSAVIALLPELADYFGKNNFIERIQQARKKVADLQAQAKEVDEQFAPYKEGTEGGVKKQLASSTDRFAAARQKASDLLKGRTDGPTLDLLARLGSEGLEAGSPAQGRILEEVQRALGQALDHTMVTELTQAGIQLNNARNELSAQLKSELSSVTELYAKTEGELSAVDKAKLEAYQALDQQSQKMLFEPPKTMSEVSAAQARLSGFYADVVARTPKLLQESLRLAVTQQAQLLGEAIASSPEKLSQIELKTLASVRLAIQEGMVEDLLQMQKAMENAISISTQSRAKASAERILAEIRPGITAAEANLVAIEARKAEEAQRRKEQVDRERRDAKLRIDLDTTQDAQRKQAASTNEALRRPELEQQLADAQRTKDFPAQERLTQQLSKLSQEPLALEVEKLRKEFELQWGLLNENKFSGDLSTMSGVEKASSSQEMMDAPPDVRSAFDSFALARAQLEQKTLETETKLREIQKAAEEDLTQLDLDKLRARRDALQQELEVLKKERASRDRRVQLANQVAAVDRQIANVGAKKERTERGIKDKYVGDLNVTQMAAELEAKYGLPAGTIMAMIKQESGFNPGAVSNKGARGLMQLMPGTAKEMARKLGVPEINTPALNLEAGAAYMAEQYQTFKGNMALALAAYNAGPGAVQRAGNKVPRIAETQDYVAKILPRIPGRATSAPPSSKEDLIETQRAFAYDEARQRAAKETIENVQRNLRDRYETLKQALELQEKIVQQAIQSGNLTGITQKFQARQEAADRMLDAQQELVKALEDETDVQRQLTEIGQQRKLYSTKAALQTEDAVSRHVQNRMDSYQAEMSSQYPLTPELIGYRQARGIGMTQAELAEQAKFKLAQTYGMGMEIRTQADSAEMRAAGYQADLNKALEAGDALEAARLADAVERATAHAKELRTQFNGMREVLGQLSGDAERFGATWAEELGAVSLRNVVADLQQAGFALGDLRKNIESSMSGFVQGLADDVVGFAMRGFVGTDGFEEIRAAYSKVAEASGTYNDTIVQRAVLLREIQNTPALLKEDPYIRANIIQQTTLAQQQAEQAAKVQIRLAEIELEQAQRKNSLWGRVGETATAFTSEVTSTFLKTFLTDAMSSLFGGRPTGTAANPIYTTVTNLPGGAGAGSAGGLLSSLGEMAGEAWSGVKEWLGFGAGAARGLGEISAAVEKTGWGDDLLSSFDSLGQSAKQATETVAGLGQVAQSDWSTDLLSSFDSLGKGAEKAAETVSGLSDASTAGARAFQEASEAWAKDIAPTFSETSKAAGKALSDTADTVGNAAAANGEGGDAGQWGSILGSVLQSAASIMSIADTVDRYEQSLQDYDKVWAAINEQRESDKSFGRVIGQDAGGGQATAFTKQAAQSMYERAGLTSAQAAAARTAEQKAPEVNLSLRNVNVLDPGVLGDYVTSEPGEKKVMNIMTRNARTLKHIINTA